jgi:3-phosphoshikimate 1-carboxyvinyltransferase
MLAFAGGEYTLRSSLQMEKRPMQPLIAALRAAGVEIICLKNEDCFPFIIRSHGVNVEEMSIDTAVSSQFASAILMSAPLCKKGLKVCLTGNRTEGAYIAITANMLSQFGVRYEKTENTYRVYADRYGIERYEVEPDFSAAGYFFAAGALLNRKTTVKGLHRPAMQGDQKFLDVLSGMGATIEENEDGISVCGNGQLHGITVNMNDFSDQALTLAAIAPFADSPTTITGIGHIRKQECDRIYAMETNLAAMGVKTETREDGITVYPCKKIREATIRTFGDHRVAMSFTVAGLYAGGITIEDPACTKKTFENFFTEVEKIYYN